MSLIKTMLENIGGQQLATSIGPAEEGLTPEQSVLQSLQAILRCKTPDKQEVIQSLATARTALESLPLTTTEYGQAAAALENAFGYIKAGVDGAAHYELRRLYRKMRGASDVL